MFVQSPTPQLAPDFGLDGADRPPAGAPAAGAAGRARLAVEVAEEGGTALLAMAGRLVAETAVAAEARILTTIVLAERPLRLVIDLSRVEDIDPAGVALLTKARFAARAARADLHLVAPDGGAARASLPRHLRRITVRCREDLDAAPPAHAEGA
ncbi:STAS domain-containing protein [Actinomadura sp. DSM 109109]|nr:STAS domain-containing protein [Actinomadura lepetitiana]